MSSEVFSYASWLAHQRFYDDYKHANHPFLACPFGLAPFALADCDDDVEGFNPLLLCGYNGGGGGCFLRFVIEEGAGGSNFWVYSIDSMPSSCVLLCVILNGTLVYHPDLCRCPSRPFPPALRASRARFFGAKIVSLERFSYRISIWGVSISFACNA